MIVLLIVVATAFLFLSSSLADVLGLQTARATAFAAIIGLLAVVALARRPVVAPASAMMALVLTWLLSLMALVDLDGRIGVFDFKVVLPILVLLVGPAAVHGLKRVEPARLFYALIALYVLATCLMLATGAAGTAVRGYGRFLRYDVSGSLVTHASLCAIALILAVAASRTASRAATLAFHATVALAATAMLLLAATRTALVAFALYAVLSLIAGPERDARATRFVGASVLALVGLLLYSAVWSDAFLARLISADQADYTSGRIVSVRHWLGMVEERPLGLGPGAVRDLLADGRPDIDGENLLEWPHNEIVRFVVEGGPFGGAFILVLLGGVVRGAIVAARREADVLRRALLLAIAADLVAQCLLQNYLNDVYQATVLLLFFAMLGAAPKTAAPGISAPRGGSQSMMKT